jgi:hypothetical protein
MKKNYFPRAIIFLVPISFCIVFTTVLPAQNFQWVRGPFQANSGNISYSNYPSGICLDERGNSYAAGYFRDSVRFDSTFLYYPQNAIYIMSYNTSGNLRWAKRAGISNLSITPSDIAYDYAGNIYITGSFSDSINFSTAVIYSYPGKTNGFIFKYDTLGNFISAQSIISPNNIFSGPSVSCVNSSATLVAGTFKDSLKAGAITISSADSNNFYLAKYDNAGNVLSVKIIGSNSCNAARVSCDQNKNIFFSGMFRDSVWINSSVVAYAKGGAFISKFDSSGVFNWATTLIGNGVYLSQIKTDAMGNVYAAGSFNDSLSLGTINLFFAGVQHNVFLAKYNATGNCLWAKRITDTTFTQINTHGLVVTGKHVYVAGEFTRSIVFNGIPYNSTGFSRDIFIAKYDSAGSEVSWKQAGSSGEDYCYDMDVDANGYIYITGSTRYPAFFDSIKVSDSTVNHFAAEGSYIAKIFADSIPLTMPESKVENNFLLFPDPANAILIIKSSELSIDKAEILDPLGREVLHLKNINYSYTIVDIKNLKAGIYFLKIKASDKILCKKFVVQR